MASVVQYKIVSNYENFSSNKTSLTVALDAAATANNHLLVITYVDKNSGGFTTQPTGFAELAAANHPAISMSVYHKIATGGETSATINWTSQINGGVSIICEIEGVSDIEASIFDTSGSNTSVALGPLTPLSDNSFAVSFGGLDSAAVGTDFVWNNGFIELIQYAQGGTVGDALAGSPGFSIATKSLSDTSDVSTTMQSPADESMSGLLIFSTTEQGGSTPPTVNSITVPTSGNTAIINFNENILPSTGITGFFATVNGNTRSITTERIASSTVTLTFASVVYTGDTVSISYTPGNVVNESGDSLASFTQAATNNSSQTTPTINTVVWAWSGAVQSNSASVTARMSEASTTTRLMVYNGAETTLITQSAFSSPSVSNNNTVRLNVSGLSPNTSYVCYIEDAGVEDTSKPIKFTTFPIIGTPTNFSFSFSSCALTGSTSNSFTRIKDRSPRFFMHMGDLHYQDISSNDVNLFRTAYNSVLTSSTQSDLYRNIPIDYIWDDHDFGPNNSSGDSPSRPAACSSYRENVPHYNLPSTNDAIYHSFVFGRVRFVVTDLRSERTNYMAGNANDRLTMSSEQRAWFFSELESARDNGQVVVWVNTYPWIGSTGDDGWYAYPADRIAIADWIKDNNMSGRICIISGDAHMLAADDGTNSDYATGGGSPIPICHAAALGTTGGTKGGPYSEGSYAGNGQYGVMTITDNADETILFSFNGYNSSDVEQISMDFALNTMAEPIEELVSPTITNSVPGHNRVVISWNEANGGSAPYSYQLQISNDEVTWNDIIDGNISPVVVSGLSQTTTYFFRLITNEVVISNILEITTTTKPAISKGNQLGIVYRTAEGYTFIDWNDDPYGGV